MVIGYDAKRCFNNSTGLGNYSRMIVSGMAEERPDWRMVLYTPTMNDEFKSYFHGNANVSTRRPAGLWTKIPDIWRKYGIARLLENDDVDIYHGLSHELPHGIPDKVKKVVTMHDLVAWRNPEYFTRFDAKDHQKKQQFACAEADVIVAISEQTKRDLIDIMHVPEEKIRVIYQSCDQLFWEPLEKGDIAFARSKYHLPQKYLVTVGTIEKRKNQRAIVEAMRFVDPDVKLVIIGHTRGEYGFALAEDIRRNFALRNRIQIVEDADFEDFPAIYASALGSVYMSRFEGFGIPILESICSHTPVLTSNCSSMPEAGGDAALYADPNNIEEIGHQMQRLISDEALRNDLIAKGEIQKMKFTYERVIEQYNSLYCELAGIED